MRIFLLIVMVISSLFIVACEEETWPEPTSTDQTAELEGSWQRERLVWYYAPDDSSVNNYNEPIEVYRASDGLWSIYYNDRDKVTLRQFDYYIQNGLIYRGSSRLNIYQAHYYFSRDEDTISLRSDFAHIVSIPYESDSLPANWPKMIDTLDVDSIVSTWEL